MHKPPAFMRFNSQISIREWAGSSEGFPLPCNTTPFCFNIKALQPVNRCVLRIKPVIYMTASYGAGVKLLLTQLLLALNTNTARANHTHLVFLTSCREEIGLPIVISCFDPIEEL